MRDAYASRITHYELGIHLHLLYQGCRDPGGWRCVVHGGGVAISQVEDAPFEWSEQVAHDLAGVAGVALGVDAVLVVAPVVALAQQFQSFLDAPARQCETALFGVERAL